MHEIFDIDEWQKKIPLELIYAREPDLFAGEQITSPADLLAVLATRSRLPIFQDAPSVPTDIFVFGFGEPAIPYTTKVGGVPFRPSNKPWPEHDGKKMTFLAQFCFSDSFDLFSFPLPGDLLEIFLVDFPNIERDTYYHYEWYNREEVKRPMAFNDVPSKSFLRANFAEKNNTVNWYCVKHRTVDYPQAASLVMHHPDMNYVKYDRLNKRLQGYEITTVSGFDRFIVCRDDLLRLAVFDGTKIGGTSPFYFGDIIDRYGSEVVKNKNNHFLCSLASIWPICSSDNNAIPYPFVNHPAPIPSEECDQYRLCILDVGCFHFYMSNDGEMFCEWST